MEGFSRIFWNGLAVVFFTLAPAVVAWGITGSVVVTVAVGFIALGVTAYAGRNIDDT